MTTTDHTNPDFKSDLVFRTMTQDDAEGLCQCIWTCYSDTYPAEEFYDPEKIRTLLRQGLLHSQIAITRDGRIVGHFGTMLERNQYLTADSIAGIVDPAYRGHDIVFRLGANMVAVYQELGLIGVQLYAVTVHIITQKMIHSAGGIDTGMLLAHFPANTDIIGFNHTYGNNRIVAALMYIPLHAAPKRVIYPPKRYRDIIQNMYVKLGYERSAHDADSKSDTKSSVVSVKKNLSLGIVQISVQKSGHDLIDCIARFQQQFRLEGIEAMYVDLSLGDPATVLLVDDLRSLGLFYGGVILERGGTDILRLQCLINANIKPEAGVLADDYGKTLLDFVMSDAQDIGTV
jgi:hypothetical protein